MSTGIHDTVHRTMRGKKVRVIVAGQGMDCVDYVVSQCLLPNQWVYVDGPWSYKSLDKRSVKQVRLGDWHETQGGWRRASELNAWLNR